MKEVVLALGSNIGDTLGNLQEAVALLEENGCVVKAVSRLYQTEPWGYADREPAALLELTQSIEQGMGRKKLFVNGPRNIDVDILIYEDVVVESERLTIPHPRIGQRLFVLQPLMDIVPDWEVPGCGTVRQLFADYDGNERIELTTLALR